MVQQQPMVPLHQPTVIAEHQVTNSVQHMPEIECEQLKEIIYQPAQDVNDSLDVTVVNQPNQQSINFSNMFDEDTAMWIRSTQASKAFRQITQVLARTRINLLR